MESRRHTIASLCFFSKLLMVLITIVTVFSYTYVVKAAEPDSTYEITVDTSYKSLGEREEGDPEDKVSDTRFTSALWHDIAVQYQGGNHFMLAGVWDIPKQKYEAKSGGVAVDEITFADTATYKLPINAGLQDGDYTADNLAKIVVWEYELKTYKNKAGQDVEYYERVPRAEAPVVTYANEKVIVLKGLNPENPIAVMIDYGQGAAIANDTQAVLDDDGYKYDPYWHLYYTDGYAKEHDNFGLEFYNYEKSSKDIGGTTVNYITITGYHDGLEDYVGAATVLAIEAGRGSAYPMVDSVESSAYGNSPVPEELSFSDYRFEDWNIPSEWTDPYDGITYKVLLGKNYEEIYESALTYYPVFPAMTKNITVDTGVGLPDDASYLFNTIQGFGFSHGWEGSNGHGWVGMSGGPLYNASAEDYPSLTNTITTSFAFVGSGKIGSNVKDMSYMFHFRSQSYGLSNFDISKLDTSSATDMSYMLDVNLYDGSAIKGLSSINTASAEKLKRMFSVTVINKTEDISLTGENVAGFDISKATDITEMFADSDITEIDLSGFNFSNIENMQKMFWRCKVLGKVTFAAETNTAGVTDMSKVFEGCSNLAEIVNLNALDTQNVTTMADMFGNYFYRTKVTGGKQKVTFDYPGPCVETLDLSGFNTSKVTDMSGMFYLPEVTSLNISGLDTSSVTNMTDMFYLPKVTSLDVSTMNTSNVISMGNMFNLASVSSLDVHTFDAAKVTDMSGMFTLDKAESLIFGLNTSNVSYMSGMFNLASIKTFDIAMDISSATSLPDYTLDSCKSLKIKYTGDNSKVQNAMSINAPSLVTLDLSEAQLSDKMLSQYTFDEWNSRSLVDIYLPKILPNEWSSIPVLPAKFYIVGQVPETGENPTEIESFETLVGDKSEFAVLKGDDGKAYVDPYTDRAVLPLEDAILVRAAEINPVEAVQFRQPKKDEQGYNTFDEETGEIILEEEEVTEITLYKYYAGNTLKGYSSTAEVYAVTTPKNPRPYPLITWKVDENPDEENSSVISVTNNGSYAEIKAESAGKAEITVTADGYDKSDGSEVQNFTAKIKVTVIPVYRITSFLFDKSSVTIKPGESVVNAASAKNMQNPDKEAFLSSVTYKSSDETIATVDKDGKITAVAIGTAVITASVEDPDTKDITCNVSVTEQGDIVTQQPNWYYLGADGSISDKYAEGSVLIVGSFDSLDIFKSKKSFTYDKATKTLTLNGFDEANISIMEEGITILLKGSNFIRGYGKPAADAFCPDAKCTIKAEDTASLVTIVYKDSSVDLMKNITVDSSVKVTNNSDGTVTFAGAKAGQPTPTPTIVPVEPSPTVTPTATPTQPKTSPTITPTATPELPKAGTKEKSKDGTASYKVTGETTDGNGDKVATVSYTAPEGKTAGKTTVTIPATVTLADGTKAVVTEIAPKAFYKNKKIKSITIGKNVTKIGKNAFYGCKNLKKITIKSKKFKKNSIGKNAFKGIYKKATVYIPKSLTKKKISTYKSIIKKAGLPSKGKIKKK